MSKSKLPLNVENLKQIVFTNDQDHGMHIFNSLIICITLSIYHQSQFTHQDKPRNKATHCCYLTTLPLPLLLHSFYLSNLYRNTTKTKNERKEKE